MKSGTEKLIDALVAVGHQFHPVALGDDAAVNPEALRVGGHVYPTVVIHGTRVAFTNTHLYEHNGRAWFGDSSATNPDSCTIAGIVTPTELRGNRRGSIALTVILATADRLGIALDLQPAVIVEYAKRGTGALSAARLRAWYHRHGFVGAAGAPVYHRPAQK